MQFFLIVALATLAQILPISQQTATTLSATTFEEVAVSGPSIVIEGDIILLTNSGDPKKDINLIEVFDQNGSPVKIVSGCGSPSCSTDVSDLSAGTYDVTITYGLTTTYSDTVVKS